MPRHPEYPAQITREWVQTRLDEAGATLLALPTLGYRLGVQTARYPEIPPQAGDTETDEADTKPHTKRPRIPAPDPKAIERMDEAWQWLQFIPADRFVLRRIVGLRALVNPLTDKRLYSFAKIADKLRAHPKAVERWHAEGIGIIVSELKALSRIAA